MLDGLKQPITNCNPKILFNSIELGLIESTCRRATLPNFANRWLRTTAPESQPNSRFVNGYMAILQILKTCVFVYLPILSEISVKIIMAEQVRPGYPKENRLTKTADYLPQLQLEEIIGNIKIGFGNIACIVNEFAILTKLSSIDL